MAEEIKNNGTLRYLRVRDKVYDLGSDNVGQKIDNTYIKNILINNAGIGLLMGNNQTVNVPLVTGIKGSAETDYRTGNVNISKVEIGLGNVDNTADKEKHVLTAEALRVRVKLTTDLNKTGGTDFDGSGGIDIGTKGVLPPTAGGTGSITLDTVNVGSANKLKNSRTILVNLGSPEAAGFDGSSNVSPGISGILGVSNGGTGSNTLATVNVGSANKLANERTITLTGAITGSVGFDGSKNVSINTTLTTVNSNTTDKFSGKRTITLTGAVNGSADWDGSGNLTISTTNALTTESKKEGYVDLGIGELQDGTDFARIRLYQESTDQGELEIAVADNGDEPIYVRQYGWTGFGTIKDNVANAFHHVVREATILGKNGETKFPVSVSAPVLAATTRLTAPSSSTTTDGSIWVNDGKLYYRSNGRTYSIQGS